jgi:TonB family protein
MKFIPVLVVFAVSAAVVQLAPAQTSTAKAEQRSVWASPLVPPTYPPLARAARIAGDVQVRIGVRRDGTVASAEVVSGHPMLQPAALASAQKSTFRCSPECTDE